MLVGVPGLAAALLAWGWRGSRRTLALTAGAALFSLALALPTLVAHNWNSACAGMMRYAFWGAMPLLFAVLLRLRERPHWPRSLLAMLVVVQLASIVHARSYNETEFSPLAKWVLAHAPGAYNPEPEVFMDRSTHVEKWLDASLVGRYEVDGVVVKQLFNLHNPAIDTALCGRGRTLAAGNNIASADRDWRYINGPIRCTAAAELPVGQAGLRMLAGWSYVEHGGGEWEGAWSASARARLSIEIDPPHRPAHLMLRGHYFDGNHRTRVTVDGVDLGWQQLDQQPALPVPPAPGAARALEVELEFDAPRVPRPGEPDQRQLAFFLQKVTTR
jgi:hypothetical protein